MGNDRPFDPTHNSDRTASHAQRLRRLPPLDLQALIERRFHQGYRCPRCHSRHYHGHGQYRGRHRFKCVHCGKTFNELTGTPLHGTRYPEKWLAYLCCMAWGLSLRRTAALVGISVPTAFAWRHKLLAALRRGTPLPVLEGIVELDELYVLHSEKGNRQLDRPPRRRGTGRAMSRWLARPDRACVLAVHDRREGDHLVVTGHGPPTVFDVERVLPEPQFRPTVLCVDNRQAYWSYAVRHRLPRELFHVRQRRRGLFHMGRVDRYLQRFMDWMTRFNGVATRYLPQYVHWFTQVYEAERWEGREEAISQLWLLRAFDVPVDAGERRFTVA